ncbi:tyrosine-protein phosphatase [Mammaliicoccus lentus]|uniref:tyrosine-protein phosphatase n=1 Tax=Mammaliicoccus lentus TaxID=42858 RepID=UPI0035177B6A
MIDIHNHLLVGVDDGPRSSDEMIELLRQAKRQGIEGIIVTPHHLHPRYQNEFPKVENLLKELKENPEVKQLSIDLYPEVKQLSIDLYPGQEIRVTDDILTDIENKDIQGLHYSKYLLLELPSDHIPAFATRLIYEIQNKGFVPIIAHPERNKAIAKDINLLFELINIGALSQMTASSLTGDFGKSVQKISIEMIEHRLVHFIASDAHHAEKRPFGFDKLFTTSKIKYLKSDIEDLLTNNEAIINNKKILIQKPLKYERKKFLGLF